MRKTNRTDSITEPWSNSKREKRSISFWPTPFCHCWSSVEERRSDPRWALDYHAKGMPELFQENVMIYTVLNAAGSLAVSEWKFHRYL